MGWEGECGKEWEGVGKGPPIGTFRGLGDGNGGIKRDRWRDRDGQADSSFPLPVPYSFLFLHSPLSIALFPSPYPCFLSIPFLIFFTLFPIRSLFCPSRSLSSPRHSHIFPPGPASVPPFTCFHTAFPTWICLSVCTSVPRYPCVCTRMDALARALVHMHIDTHPYAPPCTQLPIPEYPPGCMPSRMPSHIPSHASAPAHPGVHISVHMDVPLDVRMDTDLTSSPDVPTYRYLFTDLHPGTFGHMHGEAPTHPSMDMGPRIGGSVPSPRYRYTDIYTRKDGHMCGHIGKKGRSQRKKKRGDRHMVARTVLWIWVCMWSYVCTRGSTPSPPIL